MAWEAREPKNATGWQKLSTSSKIGISLAGILSLGILFNQASNQSSISQDGSPLTTRAENGRHARAPINTEEISAKTTTKATYSTYENLLEKGKVTQANILYGRNTIIHFRTSDGKSHMTVAPPDAQVHQTLKQNEVPYEIQPLKPEKGKSLFREIAPFLFIAAIIMLYMRWQQRNMAKAMGGQKAALDGLSKSKAKLVKPEDIDTRFDDIAGVNEAVTQIQDIVDYFKAPQKYHEKNAKLPKGTLLVGPPGTGKTLLAKATAGEAKVPFFYISGSDFTEMLVGVGSSRVVSMFEEAKKVNGPCIIFIDEIDAVGKKRGSGMGSNDERENTLNQLLVQMDGFEDDPNIILVAATNRPEILDAALLRPGRFSRQIVVPTPDMGGREKILKIYIEKTPIADDVDIHLLARATPGFSGADLANLVNEAALLSVRGNAPNVTMAHFAEAKDIILMGEARSSSIMSKEERENTAYHEAGHAVVCKLVPGNDNLEKVTIVPRGRALGVTLTSPDRDRTGYNKKELMGRLAMLFGGRKAEELKFGKDSVTTGASNDIQKATNLAQRMVTEWGFSEGLGLVRYTGDEDAGFLGGASRRSSSHADTTQQQIDAEIKQINENADKVAEEALTSTEGKKMLEIIAQGLLDYETINDHEITMLLEGKELGREKVLSEIPRPETKNAPDQNQSRQIFKPRL